MTNHFDGTPSNPSRRLALGWFFAASSSSLLAACGGGGNYNVGDINVGGAADKTAPWADDIQTFAANVRSVHPDPNGITRSAEWQNLLLQITNGAAQKTDKANLVECMRLAALMHDDHTQAAVAANYFAQTDLRFATAVDGYWVEQASDVSLLGATLLAIDNIPIAEVKERIKVIIPAATAAAYQHLTAPMLNRTELLWLANIGLSATQSTYLLKDPTGLERSVTLQAGSNTPLVSIYNRPGGPVLPLWLSQPDRNYFTTTLSASSSVYVRYARCAVDPAVPVDAFFDGISQTLLALSAPRLIFDLRNNPGGDSSILANAIQRVASKLPTLQQPRIAVLVNGGSFSSATANLYDLLKLGARSFGEPPGTPPNHTSEVRVFTLPRTGTLHSAPTKMSVVDPALGSTNYSPTVVVAPTVDDRANGRDPVLKRVEQFMLTGG